MKVASFKKMSSSRLDYYTVWSDYLMLASMLLLLAYVVGVYVQNRNKSSIGIGAQRLRCIVRGILIFTAVNVVAVLLASSHMDSYFEKRLEMGSNKEDDEENEGPAQVFVPLDGVKKTIKHNFRGHVLPVLLAVLLLFVLKFTARFEKGGSNGYSCAAALVFGAVFVTLYLSVPSKGTKKPAVFVNKLNQVYQQPRTSTLILFVSVLLVGSLAGNLY